MVDHVGTRGEHALCGGLAGGRVGEAGEVRGLGEVLDLHLDVGVGRLGAGDVARLELLDQIGLDAAHEADVARLGLLGRDDTGEVGALLLGEHDVLDVGALGVGGVDERELGLGVVGSGFLDGRGVGEAHGDHVGVAGLDQLLQSLLAGGLGLAGGRHGLLGLGAELGLGLVETLGGRVVEGLVTTAAHVIGHADLDRGATGRAGGLAAGRAGLGVVGAAAGGEGERGGRERGRDLDDADQG